MKKSVIFYIFLYCSFVNAQKIGINYQGDTIYVNSRFNNIDRLILSSKINSDSLQKYYWILYNLNDKDKELDKEFLDISVKTGDVFFGYFVNQYIDSICIKCTLQKKYFIYWYLMNYYFVPTGLLYGDKENTFCPCLIKKLQFPDSGMYVIDSLNKLYCIPIEGEQKRLYKKIFTFNPLVKDWKNLVSNWGRIYPKDTIRNSLVVKHPFSFFYKDSIYEDSITFNEYIYSKSILPLGKDASILNQKLSINIDTSLIRFLKEKLSYINSDIEKANFILSFVQQSIRNKTDMEIFNLLDKTILPEETLFRGVGDCEDKSFLLAYLFRNLLPKKNDVIVIVYNDHVNVGINLQKSASFKNSIKYKNKKYILCETTNSSLVGFLTNLVSTDKILEIIPIK